MTTIFNFILFVHFREFLRKNKRESLLWTLHKKRKKSLMKNLILRAMKLSKYRRLYVVAHFASYFILLWKGFTFSEGRIAYLISLVCLVLFHNYLHDMWFCWTLTFNMKILSLALSYIWIFQSYRGALSYVFIIALSDVFPLFNLCYSISLKMNGGRYYNDFLEEFSFNLKVKACCCLLLAVFAQFKSTDCESTLSSTFDLSFVVNTSAKRLSSKGSRGDSSFKVEKWFSVFPMNSFFNAMSSLISIKKNLVLCRPQISPLFFPIFYIYFPYQASFSCKMPYCTSNSGKLY